MAGREVKVIIERDGSRVTYEVNGATGTECDELTKRLEDATGVVETRDIKPEYYETRGGATRTR